MKIITSKSEENTQKVAKEVAQNLLGGDVLALIGDLGGGKTTFVKGIASYFKIKEEVQSPTFNLIKEYNIKINGLKKLYHMDMYRIENEKEAQNLGLSEIFDDFSGISVIEWANNIKSFLPKRTKFIEFDFIDEKSRKIIIK